MDKEYQSGDVGRAALRMALSETRVEESILREELAKLEIRDIQQDLICTSKLE